MSKIEQIIDEIEALIDNSKPVPFSSSNISVNRDEIEALLAELKEKAPEEIKEYQKMIANRESILADAKTKADAIIKSAQVQTDQLVSEHQIMQQAYAKANEVVLSAKNKAQGIVDEAQTEANNIRLGAIAYTDKMLASVESIIAGSIQETEAKSNSYIQKMSGYLDVVSANRRELAPASAAPAGQE